MDPPPGGRTGGIDTGTLRMPVGLYQIYYYAVTQDVRGEGAIQILSYSLHDIDRTTDGNLAILDYRESL